MGADLARPRLEGPGLPHRAGAVPLAAYCFLAGVLSVLDSGLGSTLGAGAGRDSERVSAGRSTLTSGLGADLASGARSGGRSTLTSGLGAGAALGLGSGRDGLGASRSARMGTGDGLSPDGGAERGSATSTWGVVVRVGWVA